MLREIFILERYNAETRGIELDALSYWSYTTVITFFGLFCIKHWLFKNV